METLFEEKTIYRRSNGQFATKEMAYADIQASENRRLALEVEKYQRMYLAVVKENKKLKQILTNAKEILIQAI